MISVEQNHPAWREYLRTGLHTTALHALNSLGRRNPHKIWIVRETLPVPTGTGDLP